MKYFILHPFKALKTYLPKSMFGRALVILAAPLIIVETISAYVFFDNHWDNVTTALAGDIAGEAATIISLYDKIPKETEFNNFLAANHLNFTTTFLPKEKFKEQPEHQPEDNFLEAAFEKHIFTPYVFTLTPKEVVVKAAVKGGILKLSTSRKRLHRKSFLLFSIWVAATSAFFLCVAAVFMHNQIKPIRRLAIAATRFGKGRTFRDFKPEGAEEIRKVARAFLDMKERLHRQLTQRTEMLAGVSHDLKTPLTRMQLQLAMMPESPETEGLLKDVEDMSTMLEGYLTFARGEGLEEAQEVNMNGLIQEAVKGRAHPENTVHYRPRSLPTLTIKPNALKRCITNLINNACRYGKEVWVNVMQKDDQFYILVEDDGPGIPDEQLEAVFKPFFRIDTSRNTATGGVGLGLTIARDIAHYHGGDLVLTRSLAYGGLQASLILPG